MRHRRVKPRTGSKRAVADYDGIDTTTMVNPSKPLKFENLGLKLPDMPPTQVISIRLPSGLLNELRAISSETDVPYQALIKMFLAESVSRHKKKSAA